MRRPLILVALLSAALALPATAGAADPVRLAAKVRECSVGPDATDRAAVFTGAMPRSAGAAVLAMRFHLYERREDGGFHRLKVDGFGDWLRSDPNVAGFIYDKRVEMLDTPADYRVRVQYRWYDASDKVLRRAVRTSRACREPDLRPDLSVSDLQIDTSGAPDAARYTVAVENAGRSAASVGFEIGLTIDGVAVPAQSLPSLDDGARATLTFVAARCRPGAIVRATADPGRVVDEASERDNSTAETCPGA